MIKHSEMPDINNCRCNDCLLAAEELDDFFYEREIDHLESLAQELGHQIYLESYTENDRHETLSIEVLPRLETEEPR